MKLANINQTINQGQIKKLLQSSTSAALGVLIIFSLAVLAVRPAAAQEENLPAAPSAFWNIQTVEDPPYLTDMTDRSARFDSANNPHVAFGGDHLYYARWNPTTKVWFITTVDYGTDVGRFASLALDSSGNPRIAYYDAANGALKFAYSMDGGYNWFAPFTVATFGPAPVANTDPENPTIEQAQAAHTQNHLDRSSGLPDKTAGSEAVQETGVGGYTSIATDSQNRVHISYYDWTAATLEYARWDGVTWYFQTIDSNPGDKGYDVGKFSSLRVDLSGLAHISYMDEKYDGLKYAYDTGNGWAIEEIDSRLAPNFRFGGFSSLVLDGSGNPYISYQDWQNFNLLMASPAVGGSCSEPGCRSCGPSGSWQCRIVDSADDTGWFTSIGRSNSALMISYYDSTNGDLHYAESSNGRSWSRDTLVSSGDVGLFTSLAVDTNGYPGISYYTASSGLFSFIRYNGSGWTNSGIIYGGELGPFSSLQISQNFNVPYISYFSETSDQLKLTSSLGPGLWYPKFIASGGGGYSSLKLNQAGDPRIAYYDFINGNLVFAYISGGTWYFQTIDSGGDVGMYPSLQLDSSGRPYISYQDVTNQALKFAYWNGSVWVVQFVEDSNAYVGAYNALAVNKSTADCYAMIGGTTTCPTISYYDASNKVLKVAFLSTIGAWATQVVDPTLYTGKYTSIDTDYLNRLHISYYAPNSDDSQGALKHAVGVKGASAWSWSTEVVDSSTTNVGRYTSLAVDIYNQVHVSYYNATGGDLKYALYSGFWSTEYVDTNGDTGIGTSLALFANGQPAISYYDYTNGALRFATPYSGQYGKSYYLPHIGKNN